MSSENKDELSIKVSIGGRTYPLTIARSEEEAIRKAAKRVDKTLLKFQESYAVRDKQDLLAMTALQMATASPKDEAPENDPEMEGELLAIRDLLKGHLS